MLTLFSNSAFSIPRTLIFGLVAGFLVTVPVFVQAPLVRSWPWMSLVLTLGWFSLSRQWRQPWGSLIWGFGLTWLCGSIYWGWYRWEPLWHLPMEGLALPFAIWGLSKPQYRVGSCFYLGSLWGTIVTDVYFWLTDLLPLWRIVINLDQPQITTALYWALIQIQTPWGLGLAVFLSLSLVWLAITVLKTRGIDRCVFAGAVLFTLVTDSLFGVGILTLSSQSVL